MAEREKFADEMGKLVKYLEILERTQEKFGKQKPSKYQNLWMVIVITSFDMQK